MKILKDLQGFFRISIFFFVFKDPFRDLGDSQRRSKILLGFPSRFLTDLRDFLKDLLGFFGIS